MLPEVNAVEIANFQSNFCQLRSANSRAENKLHVPFGTEGYDSIRLRKQNRVPKRELVLLILVILASWLSKFWVLFEGVSFFVNVSQKMNLPRIIFYH